MVKAENITIIGSGPAGYTAAIYAARAGLSPLMISGLEQGGQLMITTDVENYPGFEKPVQGPWLMEQMKNQAKSFGTRILVDFVKDVDLNSLPFEIKTEKEVIKSNSIVIATGAKANWLNIKGEQEFMGFGVSACATCDGFFFKDKDVAVVGGGNTAVEEALFLSNLCRKVYIIHRRDKLRAEKILQERLFKNPKVEIIWNSQLKEIIGIDNPLSVEGIKIENLLDKKELEISCKGVFIAIGHAPSNELIINQLETHNGGYVVTKPNSTETSIPGVFAAGDITDFKYRQAVTAAGMGCMAALEAEKFLAEKIG